MIYDALLIRHSYHEMLFMIDTCQANTMYSKFYSPNILATPSTRELDHLEQNLEAGVRVLGPVEMEQLDRIGGVVVPEADL